MKSWPGSASRRQRPVEILTRDAESNEPEPDIRTEVHPDGEVMSNSGALVSRAKLNPVDDRNSLRMRLEGYVPMHPFDSDVARAAVVLPNRTLWNSTSSDDSSFRFELMALESRLNALETSPALPTGAEVVFSAAATAYLSVPERPGSVGEAIAALERSIMFTDPGSAKELLRRVRRALAAGQLMSNASKEMASSRRELLTKLFDATANVSADDGYLRHFFDRVDSLAPLHSVAKQNFVAVHDAVSAACLARQLDDELSVALDEMEAIVAANEAAVYAKADSLLVRLRAVAALEASH